MGKHLLTPAREARICSRNGACVGEQYLVTLGRVHVMKNTLWPSLTKWHTAILNRAKTPQASKPTALLHSIIWMSKAIRFYHEEDAK